MEPLNTSAHSRRAVLIAAASILGTSVCPAEVDQTYEQKLKRERDEAGEHFKGPHGPLTLISRFSPKEGTSTLGRDPSCSLILPVAAAPSHVGDVSVNAGKAVLRFSPSVQATVNGKPATTLEADAKSTAQPSATVGSLRIHLYFIRNEQLQISVSDPNAQLRKDAQPLSWFPIDKKLRVVADWVPYEKPKTVSVPDNDGSSRERSIPGFVSFTMEGKKLRLTAVLRPDNPKLFFVFGDTTNNHETYGAGRFLDADPPVNGKVTLDFNQAHNPLCAYNHEYLCPVAPKENRLPVPIQAGERKYFASQSS